MTADAPVRAVVFDVGRVLFHWDLRFLFAKLIPDPARLDWFLGHVVSEEWHFQHDAGRDLAEMVAERKGQFPDCAPLLDAYATRFNETIPGPVQGTAQLVERLSGNGIALFALTNFAEGFWADFRPHHPIFDHFADIVVSGVEKVSKPDPKIFRIAEQRFGYEGRELLLIDDNAANVAGARSAGWQAFQFTCAPSLERELVRRRLLP